MFAQSRGTTQQPGPQRGGMMPQPVQQRAPQAPKAPQPAAVQKAPAVATTPAPAAAAPGNCKSALNELTMRAIGRPLCGSDIVYTERSPAGTKGQFVVSVKVAALDASREFQGDAFPLKKDAEQSAARRALEFFQRSEAGQPKQKANAKGQPARPVTQIPAAPVPQPGAAAANTETNYKSALNELTMRFLNRPLKADDITFMPRPTPGQGQFRMAVIVQAIDPARQFEGMTQTRKRDAEQSAAKAALTYFKQTIPEDKLEKPKKPPKAGGGSGGKPKGNRMPKVWIWAGNLQTGTTWQELRDHMNKAGKTMWVELLSPESGFALYNTEADAAKAVETLNGSMLKNKAISVDTWGKKDKV